MKTICLLILVLSFLFCDAILDPVDFLALQSIRNSLEDMPGSNYFSSWDFTSDSCNFAGVYCEGEKVIALNLGDPRAGAPGLTGRLHPSIGKLTSLAEFTVVPGRIMGALPETFSELKILRFLAVSRNFISHEIPASLGKLRELRTLDLSYNQLTGSIPWSIGSLPALTNLILCHNHLSGSLPYFASQTLTRVDVKHNDLSGSISPDSLPHSLQYLSLSWNQLSGSVDQVLTKLNRLNYLDLSLNQFTGSIPGCVFSFPITNLQLERNQFSGPIQPGSSVNIQTVDLSHNLLYGSVSPFFATVQNLYLNNNRFTGSVPTTFVDRLMHGSIQLLYLQHNFLTGMRINPRAAIPFSSSLCLQYNCMIPPVQTPCPINAGTQKTRPTSQCMEWKGSPLHLGRSPLEQTFSVSSFLISLKMAVPVSNLAPNLIVSKLCLGTMTFGEQNSLSQSFKLLDKAYDSGINFFDSAEMYPVPQREETQGRSEEYFGRWIRERKIPRHRLIFATKVSGPSGQMTWIRGGPTSLDSKNIMEAIDNSLLRAQTDYIDLYQVHWPDRYVPMFGETDYDPVRQFNPVGFDEQLDALGKAVDAGKIRFIGVSNETPYGVLRFIQAAEKNPAFPKIVSVQNSYNLLCRNFDSGLAECCHLERVSLLAYSPLAMGLLSGKYLLPDGGPNDARLNLFSGRYSEAESRYNLSNPTIREATKAYLSIAERYEIHPVSLAIAFVLRHPLVSSAIFGATKLWQLEQVVNACNIKLSPEIIADINEVLSCSEHFTGSK